MSPPHTCDLPVPEICIWLHSTLRWFGSSVRRNDSRTNSFTVRFAYTEQSHATAQEQLRSTQMKLTIRVESPLPSGQRL